MEPYVSGEQQLKNAFMKVLSYAYNAGSYSCWFLFLFLLVLEPIRDSVAHRGNIDPQGDIIEVTMILELLKIFEVVFMLDMIS